MDFTLVGLKEFKKNEKTYYVAVVSDSNCNISTIFVEKDTYEFLKNFKYKSITQYVFLTYDRKSGYYRLSIDKK